MQKLDELGVSWQPTRTDADILWDARLTQLLSFRREHGHVQVRLCFLVLAHTKVMTVVLLSELLERCCCGVAYSLVLPMCKVQSTDALRNRLRVDYIVCFLGLALTSKAILSLVSCRCYLGQRTTKICHPG